jgi:hypothetical protein
VALRKQIDDQTDSPDRRGCSHAVQDGKGSAWWRCTVILGRLLDLALEADCVQPEVDDADARPAR